MQFQNSQRIFALLGLLAILFLLAIPNDSNCQAIRIDGEEQFDNNNLWPLENHNQGQQDNGIDYWFVNDGDEGGGQEWSYTIDLGVFRQIQDGTTIAIAPDISIIVDGSLEADGAVFTDGDGMGNPGSWGAIVLRGNGVEVQGRMNGSATFTNCVIELGGMPDQLNAGMILLANDGPNPPQISRASLLLDDGTILRNSISDGIRVYTAGGGIVPSIIIENCLLEDFAGSGIHFEQNTPFGQGVMMLNISNQTVIRWSEEIGIVHDALGGQFTINIDNSNITENGQRGISINGNNNRTASMGLTIDECTISWNGDEEFGCGVNAENFTDGTSTISILNNSDIHHNTWVGLRLWNVNSTNQIRNSEIWYNGHSAPEGPENGDDAYLWGAGVRVQLMTFHDNGPPPTDFPGSLVIEGCHIYENGHEGVAVSHAGMYGAEITDLFTTIIGNRVINNAQVIDIGGGFDIDADDPREGSGIHILGNIFHPTITNNIIEGGVSGLCWDAVQGNAFAPRHGRIRNNLLINSYYGLFIWEHSGDLVDNMMPWTTHFYNNTIWNNSVAGVYVGENVAADPLEAWQLQCNIIGMPVVPNNSIGVDWNIGLGVPPDFDYNGFWQNGGGNGWFPFPLPPNCIEADPRFIPNDFQFYWLSPMINEGRPDVPQQDGLPDAFAAPFGLEDAPNPNLNELTRDGSPNDIGVYGGAFASGVDADLQPLLFGVGIVEANAYDFDPYCRIDETVDEVTGTLLWDYYRAYSDYEVPENEQLIIESGVHVEHEDISKFRVLGLIDVDGDEDQIVTLTNIPGETWGGMQISWPADVNSSVRFTDISGALTGLYIGNVPDDAQNPAQRINLENLVVENCEYYGIDIYNSRVRIQGEHPAFNEDPMFHRNRIRFIRETEPNELTTEAGIRVSTCGYNAVLENEEDRYDVIIEDSYVGDCATPDAGALSNSGLSLLNTDGRIRNVTMHSNGVTGMSISWCGFWLNGNGNQGQELGNDLRDNGVNLAGGQADANGAEVYISGVPLPTLEVIDYNDNNGKLVFHATTWVLNVRNSWWGEDFQGQAPPQQWIEDRLYPETAISFDFGNTLQGDIDIDDFDFTFDDAARALREGQAQQALEIMEALIAEQPETNDGNNAARYIHLPYRLLNRSTESLFDFYQATAARYDTLEIASICRLMVPRIILEEHRFDEARRAYQSIVNNPRDEAEGILAQIGIMELDYSLNAGNLNNFAPHARYTELGTLMKRLNESAATGKATALPEDFALLTPYPNPFNNAVTIRYALPRRAQVKLEFYDLTGRLVETLFNGVAEAGQHRAVWRNSGNLGSGLYFLKMTTPERILSTKALLVK